MRLKPLIIAMVFGLFFVLGSYQALASESIWSRCNVSEVEAIRYLEIGADPQIWQDGEVLRSRAGIGAALAVRGDLLPFDDSFGWDLGEPNAMLGWQVLALADGTFRYALWTVGEESGDFYVYTTDSLRRYVADYGGANSWHVLCGLWKVDG